MRVCTAGYETDAGFLEFFRHRPGVFQNGFLVSDKSRLGRFTETDRFTGYGMNKRPPCISGNTAESIALPVLPYRG